MASLRQRNRINAMRSCQRTALDRFEAEGIAKPHPKHDIHVVEGAAERLTT